MKEKGYIAYITWDDGRKIRLNSHLWEDFPPYVYMEDVRQRLEGDSWEITDADGVVCGRRITAANWTI